MSPHINRKAAQKIFEPCGQQIWFDAIFFSVTKLKHDTVDIFKICDARIGLWIVFQIGHLREMGVLQTKSFKSLFFNKVSHKMTII